MTLRPIRPSGYYNREENETPAPKPKRIIYAPVEKIREVIAAIQAEDPTFSPSEKNIGLIFTWLQDIDAAGGFTLENVRVAVKVLGYQNAIERVPPPPPPPPPVVEPEPVEILQPGEISIHASEWELRRATPEQIRSYIRRLREAQQK